jgi:hypothetical protein
MRLSAALLLACVVRLIGAQRSGTTTLAVQVNQEARLDPRQVELNFRVSAGGASETARMAPCRLPRSAGRDRPHVPRRGPGGHLFQRHFPTGRYPELCGGVAAAGDPHLRGTPNDLWATIRC